MTSARCAPWCERAMRGWESARGARAGVRGGRGALLGNDRDPAERPDPASRHLRRARTTALEHTAVVRPQPTAGAPGLVHCAHVRMTFLFVVGLRASARILVSL